MAILGDVGFNTQLPFFETFPSITGQGGNVGSISGASAMFMRFRLRAPVLTNKCKIYVGAAAGNIDLMVATLDTTTLLATRLCSTGSIATAGTNAIQTLAWTAGTNVEIPAGVDLIVGAHASSSSLTLGRTVPVTVEVAFGQAYQITRTYQAFGATETVVAGLQQAAMPWIWFGVE